MATWNATQLGTEVLKQLGILGSGQVASAEDLDRVSVAYASVYPQLRKLGFAPWSSAAIEEEAQLPLAKYLAGQCASSFGFSGQRLAEHKATAQEGWIELQECSAGERHLSRPRFLDY